VADVPVVVVPYDPDWPHHFEGERRLLQQALAPWLDGGIHHFGSTAIPGIAAKPIIDIVAGVRDLDEARAAFGPLAELSYASSPHRPGIAHHFDKTTPTAAYGVHLTEPGSDLWCERLAFRDALRDHRQLAAEYEALKLRLARAHATDVAAYTAGKRAFVEHVLAGMGIPLGRR
jgi:GrpB-like predicted nucleotidyltransferase (UPF0157 family)